MNTREQNSSRQIMKTREHISVSVSRVRSVPSNRLISPEEVTVAEI